MQVHLVVDGPLDTPAASSILHTTYDLEQCYQDLQRPEPEYSALVATVLDYADPDRCPPGKHMLSLFTLAPYSRADNWHAPFESRRGPEYRTVEEYTALKEELGGRLVRQAEQLFPGLSGRVEARKVATPITLERYTFNTGGAAFGWANLPQQSGAHRPGAATPFRGLYMAGQWTFPGGSIAAAVTSGRIAAKTILHQG
jgi:phytoene dehydrogenase-like protein